VFRGDFFYNIASMMLLRTTNCRNNAIIHITFAYTNIQTDNMIIKKSILNKKKLAVAIVGSRSFDDYNSLCRFLLIVLLPRQIRYVVSGGAKGADSLAERFAEEFHCDIKVFPAEWRIYGPKAGYLRNHDIVESCDICFAFWDGSSKGTAHTIQLCEELNKPYFVYYFKKPLQGKLLQKSKSLHKSMNVLCSKMEEIYKMDRDRFDSFKYAHLETELSDLEERISQILKSL